MKYQQEGSLQSIQSDILLSQTIFRHGKIPLLRYFYLPHYKQGCQLLMATHSQVICNENLKCRIFSGRNQYKLRFLQTLTRVLLLTSTVTTSLCGRAPLGCGGLGDSHHGCAAKKSAPTVWHHVNWMRFFEECFQQLVNSLPQTFMILVKAKRSPTWY